MKRANKTGSVTKLNGNRRNPWYAKTATTYDEYGKPLPPHILSDDKGQKYFPDRTIPDLLLANWNLTKNNLDINKSEYTFSQVYEEYKARYFATKEEMLLEKETHQKLMKFCIIQMENLLLIIYNQHIKNAVLYIIGYINPYEKKILKI